MFASTPAVPSLRMTQFPHQDFLILLATVAKRFLYEVAGVLVGRMCPELRSQHLGNEMLVPFFAMLQNGLNHMVRKAMRAKVLSSL